MPRDGRRLAVARPLGHVRDELRAYGLAGLMEATSGTHGSVDAAIRGVGLDPTDLVVDEPVPTSPSPTDHHGLLDLSAAGPNERTALRLLAGGVAILVGAVVISLVVGGTAGRQAAGPGTVPNLVGLPLDRATTAARDAGFELADPVFVAQDDQPEGTVVDQEPPAGTIADLGSEIKPLVSTERQLVVVPDVIGLPEGEAIAALTREGLSVRRAAESEDPERAAGDRDHDVAGGRNARSPRGRPSRTSWRMAAQTRWSLRRRPEAVAASAAGARRRVAGRVRACGRTSCTRRGRRGRTAARTTDRAHLAPERVGNEAGVRHRSFVRVGELGQDGIDRPVVCGSRPGRR